MRYVITGGCGFVGRSLAVRLAREQPDALIVLLDIFAVPHEVAAEIGLPAEPQVSFVQCDLRDRAKMAAAVAGADVVIHVASFGMSGREMLSQPQLIEAINVGGTENVLSACHAHDVRALVFCSSYNAVFYGQELIAAVDPPLPDVALHVDAYSKTKTRAEQLVRARDNTLTSGAVRPGNRLRTVALRPAAIYGPGEERHMPRIIETISSGLYVFCIGPATSLVEWVYIDNLSHAFILAAGLLLSNPARIGGRAYPVSDHHPINQFEFIAPLSMSLGFPTPKQRVPTFVMLLFGHCVEITYRLLRRVWDFRPLLTRTEVLKVAVTHYFSTERVIAELGYRPVVGWEEGRKRMVDYFVKKEMRRLRMAPPPGTGLSPTVVVVAVIFMLFFGGLVALQYYLVSRFSPGLPKAAVVG